MRPPQPDALFGPVDQLTTPTMTPPLKSRNRRRAGIAGACAKARARIIGCGIDQTDLQGAGLPRYRKTRGASHTAAAAVATVATPMPTTVRR